MVNISHVAFVLRVLGHGFHFFQVFFSGCLHGDEQVGPTAVVEAAKLMVYAAVCLEDSTAKVRTKARVFLPARTQGQQMLPGDIDALVVVACLCSCVLFCDRQTAAALKCGGLFSSQEILGGLSYLVFVCVACLLNRSAVTNR